ncbi:S-layer homology domain-containing protein [Gorillibacterium sp. sgz5001074]|uniref:rhamnogalacturonan lyase family protein n=1 Tax=Gorillibacterium sp. sgz5001074 TaxID=3446695 RepID=UPI003F67F433
MKKKLKKIMSVLLTVSMAFMVTPSVVMGNTAAVPLTQVGDVLDFEDGGLAGTITGAPATTGSGSVTVAVYDSNKVLRIQPPSNTDSTVAQQASFWWTLPLDSGEYDLTGKDQVEVTFDWWVDITRPSANSLDVRLNNGADQVITLRTAGGGTDANSPATVSYYSGNMTANNVPAIGTATTALTGVPRLTKLAATLNVDLLAQVVSLSVTDGGSLAYTTPQPIAIASDKLTSMSIGASRATGQSWARFNPVAGVTWDESTYGMRVDNITFKAAASGEVKPIIPPSGVTLSPSTAANLEYGEGSLADKRSATYSAVVLPVNATDRTFTWTISDENIATIAVNADKSVTVTARGAGEATLNAVSNMDGSIKGSVPIHVTYVPPIVEPVPDFSAILAQGYTQAFGSNFDFNAATPLWIFAGGTYHKLQREDVPQINNYFRFDASGSGNRGSTGSLPSAVSGSKVYVNLDWKVPAVTTAANTFNLSFQDGTNVLLSLRTGTNNGVRTIGAFSGSLPGPTGTTPPYFWSNDRYHAFTYNEVNKWYKVGIEFDFDTMLATVSLVPRDDAAAQPSVLTVPFEGSKISSFVITGERAGGNNIGVVDNGIDNLYFFTKALSDTTITDVLPYDFLPERPATADSNTLQSWFKTVYMGDVADEAGLNLPATVKVKVAGGSTYELGVTWALKEAPWSTTAAQLAYDPNKQGVYSYEGTLADLPGVAVNKMGIKAKLYIENRIKDKITTEPFSMERLDRGVVAVPAKSGGGILVTWRLLASEYDHGLTFNVYRNGSKVNTSPVATLDYIDVGGKTGDTYTVVTVNTGTISKPAKAWEHNYMDIPLQKPEDRPNPALAYGATSNADPITYTANDASVADVNGDGQYEIVVKWYPSQAQDPGLANRHTGETIFDAYTLEGKLLWRINLGINIVSSAHHSAFNFYDLDQDGKAEFSVKTADGTRGYLPKADGTINDLTDTPAWVLGNPEAVWVGGLQNPANSNQVNNTALGRVASGPERWTVFNAATGTPVDTVDYFAPYNITSNWGDANNNRSDRFNGAVAYMPKNGVFGAEPYPTVIEVRAHYGPQFIAAYQYIDGKIVKVWSFTLAEWNAGNNQGNHNIKVADVDHDGYSEVVLGGIAIDQDGTIVWSTNGTRGTVAAGHGDALHVGAMVPDSNEIYVFQPHEASPPNNVTLVRGSSGEPVWTYSANLGDVGRGVAANVTPLPGFEVWGIQTPMYNIVSGEVITTDVGGIGTANKAPVNFILYWDGDLLNEFFDGPDNATTTGAPSITKFNYDVATKQSELTTLQTLTGTYSNNGTKANPSLIADIFGDWRDEVLVRTNDNKSLRIYTTDIPTEHVIYTLMNDPQYRLAANSQNAMYNQPAHLGFYLGEDIRGEVQGMKLPVPNIYYTVGSSGGSGGSGDGSGSSDGGSGNPGGGPAAPTAPGPVTPAPTPVTPSPKPVQPTPEKPVLNRAIANAEQTKSHAEQALQKNPPVHFSDVPETHWAAKAIQYASQLGVIQGGMNGEFNGSDQVTRAEFAAMIVRAVGMDTKGADASFSDTDGHWADAYIRALHRAGIVNGTGNGTFNPDQEITRAEMAAILARVLSMSAAGGASKFSDISGHWAADYIDQLSQAGIVNGVSEGRFALNDTATREQSVAIIIRMLNVVLDLGLQL